MKKSGCLKTTLLISLCFLENVTAQTIGAYWSFQLEQDTTSGATYETNVSFSSLNGSSPTFLATGSRLTDFNNFGQDFTAFDGTSWDPGRATTWNSAASGGSTGNSFQLTFDSSGSENFQIRFKYRNNGTESNSSLVTAFTSFEYDLGQGFAPVPGANLTLLNNSSYNNEWTADLSTLDVIDDSGLVTLRWSLPDFDEITGTQLRLDDLQITGSVTTPSPTRTRYLPTGNYNVLFISIDDLKPKLGVYGDPEIQTPTLDSFATTALQFNNAHCQQAICTASRTSLLTGLRPDTTKVWDLTAKFRDTIPNVITLPQHFRNNNYTTHAIGKVFHGSSNSNQDVTNSWSDGWSNGNAPFKYYEPANAAAEDAGDNFASATDAGEFDRDSNPVTDQHYDDGVMADQAIVKLQQYAPDYLNNGNPFFLAIGFRKPHLPFACPKTYWDLYNPADIDLTSYNGTNILPTGTLSFTKPFGTEPSLYSDIVGTPTEPQARHLIHGYMACVSYVDAQVDKVLDELDALGLSNNTVVIIWGDHGWHLADHGAFWSKHTNYEQATRSPLLIRAPGMNALGTDGLSCAAPVELIDLFPTLVDLCSLPVPPQPLGLESQGTSLLPLLEDPAQPWKKGVFSQYQRFINGTGITNPGQGMGYSIRTDRYRYTEWWRTQTTNQLNGNYIDRDIKLFGTPEHVELYDYLNDPGETVNLAGNPAYTTIQSELQSTLAGGNGWSSPTVDAPAEYPVTYASWQDDHSMPGIIAAVDLDPYADPDSDQWPNLFEYKMGSHPLIANEGLLFSGIEEDGSFDHLTFHYDTVPSRTDVTMGAHHSTTLLPGSFSETGVTTDVLSTSGEKESHRSRVLITPGSTTDFMRLFAY